MTSFPGTTVTPHRDRVNSQGGASLLVNRTTWGCIGGLYRYESNRARIGYEASQVFLVHERRDFGLEFAARLSGSVKLLNPRAVVDEDRSRVASVVALPQVKALGWPRVRSVRRLEVQDVRFGGVGLGLQL